jgi:SAM-dependent methyltransferase
MSRWHGELGAFVAQSPVIRSEIAEFVAAFAESLPPGSKVLDAGAGSAPYRPLFSHCEYRTHDWAASVYQIPGGPDIQGDLVDGLAVQDGVFDAILCTEVLEHVADPVLAIKELRRLLRAGGALAVTVPFVYPLHEEPHDHRRYTNHGLRSVLELSGFQVREVRPLGGWFSMICQVLREQAVSTQVEGRRTLGQRVIGTGCLVLSELLRGFAPGLDRRFDSRRAFPNGWAALADG